ncbi:endocuticle structural glycoprotein SgAbd-2-like [Scylla paramamosain]|uniref:endocuticle structural glycoprotein SgAbd-2-like n=1 Tax=Scylla paramamosain TaxID=85552 RepID=UPI003083C49B
MYFRLLIVCVVVAAAVAAPTYDTPIPILKDDRTQNAAGEYSFNFETGNGIVRSESGYQADGQENSGAFSYTSPDGTPVAISFTSGAGGYQPEGAVLPVAPALPYERTQVFGH